MMIKNVKNFFIMFLCFLAAYQTGQLWLEDFSSRNFFYTFFSDLIIDNSVYSTEQRSFVTPYRLIYSLGNKTFKMIYSDLLNSSDKKSCDSLLKEALQKGEYVNSYPIDWDWISKNTSVIYDYPYPIPTDIFVRFFGQKGSLLNARLKSFTQIVFVPDKLGNNAVKILFVDEDTCYEYVVNKKNFSLTQNFNYELLTYVSSKQSGYMIFNKNVFLPKWDNDRFTYSAVSFSNPYAYRGELLLNTVEKKIDKYFDNPIAKWTGIVNGVYTYSDENIVVKYYKSNVLEYFNYTSRKQSSSLVSDFEAAVKFIARDSDVSNDFYCSRYEEDDKSTTFYFDYSLNNFPLVYSETLKQETDMEHPIQVTVENGMVTRYKKLAFTFFSDDDLRVNAIVDFLGVVDSIFVAGELSAAPLSESATLDAVSLSYKIDIERQILLNWFLKIGDKSYVKSAQVK